MSKLGYGDIKVGKNATLILAGGEYQVNTLHIHKQARVYFTGPASLCVTGHLMTKEKSFFGPAKEANMTGGDIKVNVYGPVAYTCAQDHRDGKKKKKGEKHKSKAVKIGKKSVFFGQIQSLNGTIEIKKSVQATGTYVGKNIKIGKGSVITYAVESVPPSLNISIPADGSLLATSVPQLQGNFYDEGSGVDTGSVQVLLDGVELADSDNITSTGFDIALSTSLSDGEHTLTVIVSDMAGNTAQKTITFTTDTTPPVFSDLIPVNGSTIMFNVPAISGNYSDNISGIDSDSFQIFIDSTEVTLADTATETGFSFTPTLPLDNGSHTVTVKVEDIAGNAAEENFQFNVLVDFVPPVIFNVLPLDGSAITIATPTFSAGFSDDLSGVNPDSIEILLGTDNITLQADPSTTGFNFVSSPLTNGNYTLSISIRDYHGNQTQTSTTFTVLVDPNTLDQDGDVYTPNQGDCNDFELTINPGAIDIPDNGVDENCDGGDTITVPDVVGIDQAAAQTTITNGNLTVGTISTQYSNTVVVDAVISQNPAGGNLVTEGTAVELVVSLGVEIEGLPVPSQLLIIITEKSSQINIKNKIF